MKPHVVDTPTSAPGLAGETTREQTLRVVASEVGSGMQDSGGRQVMDRRVVLIPALLVFAMLTAPPAFAQVFFRMDYSAGAYPNAGWSAIPTSASWTRSHVPGAGPNGQNVIELRHLSNLSAQDYGGQFNWGWRQTIEPSDPPQGAKRYYRWRMWFSPDSNFRGVSSATGSSANISNKLLIVGQGCDTRRCRFILTYRTDRDNLRLQYFRLQLDGGVDAASTGPYEKGQWLDIQVELSSSSTSTAGDGAYRLWINNNNYSSPTTQRTGIVLHPANWGFVMFGGFNNDGLETTGIHNWRSTDFEAAYTFNSNWHGGGGGSTTTPCSFSISPTSNSMSSSGGTGQVSVSTSPSGCSPSSWTASSNASWITVTSGSSGSGSGTVSYSVASNSGSSRTGTLTIAGQTFTVSQAAASSTACSFSISPTSNSMSSSGGTGQVSVSTSPSGCSPDSWTATSNASWTTITSGSSGSGSGTVAYSVASNSGSSRTCALTIAGQTFTISQSGATTSGTNIASLATVTASSENSGTGQLAIKAVDGVVDGYPGDHTREWATSREGAGAWIQLAWSSPRTINQIVLHDRPNSDDRITGGTVQFSDGSTISIGTLPNDGTAASFPFTARSVTNLRLTVNSVSSTTRNIGLAEILVFEDSGSVAPACSFSISPTSNSMSSSGGTGQVSVSVGPSGCSPSSWTASSNVSWITVTSGSSGSGSGTVSYSVASNSGSSRTGTLTIAGQTFTVSQAAASTPCSFSISPTSNSVSSSGGTGQVSVSTSPSGCSPDSWTATSNVSWATITSGSSGSGSGTVGYSVASNSSSSRTGTLTIAGQTFTISQSGNTTSGTNISSLATVTASSENSGTGQLATKAVDGVVDGYPGDYTREWATNREGAGAWIQLAWSSPRTINQIVLHDRPNSDDRITGGTVQFNDGSTVSIGSLPNDGTAASFPFTARSVTSLRLTVNSVSSTTRNIGLAELLVFEDSGSVAPACSFSISPTSNSMSSSGGTGQVSVSVGPSGCSPSSWTASSNVSWITITSGSSGSGSGTVSYSVASNSGSSRTGTLTIAGQTFTVSQAAASSTACSFSISPTSNSMSSSGGTGQVSVSTSPSGCSPDSWTATSNASWTTITSGSSGSGSGTVSYSVASNSGSSRTCALTIAGQTFTISQSGNTTSGTNVASLATVTASSENSGTGQLAIKAVDGVVDGYPGDHTREWATSREGAGAWIQLAWSSPRTINQIVLHDRPNSDDQITGGTVQFSDGSTVSIGSLPNDGTAASFPFTARSVTSLRLSVNSVSANTRNIGLAEILVFEDSATSETLSDTRLPFTATFDRGDFSEWDGFRNSTGATIVDSGCFSGRCLRTPLLAYDVGDNYGDFYFGDHASSLARGTKVEEVWLRLYSKFSSPFTFRGNKIAIFNITDGSTWTKHYQVYIHIRSDGNYWVQHSTGPTGTHYFLQQNIGTPVPARFDQWDKLKMYVKLNTPGVANGIVRFWVNDVLKLEYTNVDIRGNTSYGLNWLNLSTSQHNQTTTDGVQWHDDFLASLTDPDADGQMLMSPQSEPTTAAPRAPERPRVIK
jgi:hypothetical protein